MTVLLCPTCGLPWVDDPDAEPTEPDGTAYTTDACFECCEWNHPG